MSSDLQVFAAPTGTVKLTAIDNANLSLNVTSPSSITCPAGGTASFAYTNVKTGTGHSVSVLIKDKANGDILYYGRVVDCERGNASGTASFKVPDTLTEGDYTLLAFNEQINDANKTDFASTPVKLTLKVGNTPAPGPGPVEPVYTHQTLTDPSGVKISGLFTPGAKLKVTEHGLHDQGTCTVCDDLRKKQEAGQLIALYDFSLASGSYSGELEVTLPAGSQYDGQKTVFLHCKDGKEESCKVTIKDGVATGAFSRLSPFALVNYIKAGVQNTTLKAKSSAGKDLIRLRWTKSWGYKVDYYQVFRSTQKSSGYGKNAFYTTKSGTQKTYKNTKQLKKGRRYYYKVRGVRKIGGELVYTRWSTKANRIAK